MPDAAAGRTRSLGELGLPLPPATAALWQRTLACVVRTLREAQTTIRSEEGRRLYRDSNGWFTPRSMPRRPHEESISSAIAKEFRRIRLNSFDSCLEEFNLNAACEVGRDVEQGIGPASKPVDLRIYNWGGPRPFDLCVEAKTTHRKTGLAEYFGQRGVERFLDEAEPLSSGLIGGMAAYALTCDEQTWNGRILDGASRKPAVADTRSIQLAPDLDPILVSVVALPEGSSLGLRLVFHIVLEFDMDPAAR